MKVMWHCDHRVMGGRTVVGSHQMVSKGPAWQWMGEGETLRSEKRSDGQRYYNGDVMLLSMSDGRRTVVGGHQMVSNGPVS